MSLIVLCAGGHARVVIEALLSRGTRPSAVTDRDSARVGTMCGRNSDHRTGRRYPEDEDRPGSSSPTASAIAHRDRVPDCRHGASCSTGFAALGYKFPVITHASAVIASDASLGDGAQVMAGAIIQPAARIGRNVLVNTRAVVEHDCQVGDHCHIAPGAVLCGGVLVGEGAHVGAGAVVLGGVSVGAGAVVAAGAVITKNVEAGAFAGGDRE